MAPKKLPAFMFYPGDWLKDTRSLTPAAKGAWIDILCAMWDSPERGKSTMPISGYARMIGTNEAEAETLIAELVDMGICESVTQRNAFVTLTCRRMQRDEITRVSGRIRVGRYREKRGCNAEVTHPSSVSSSISSSVPIPDELILTPTLSPEATQQQRRNGQEKASKALLGTYDPTWAQEPWPSLRKFVSMNNELTHKSWPAIKRLDSSRAAKIRRAIKEYAKEPEWQKVFGETNHCEFMQTYPNRGLDWLLSKGKDGTFNFTKAFEETWRR